MEMKELLAAAAASRVSISSRGQVRIYTKEIDDNVAIHNIPVDDGSDRFYVRDHRGEILRTPTLGPGLLGTGPFATLEQAASAAGSVAALVAIDRAATKGEAAHRKVETLDKTVTRLEARVKELESAGGYEAGEKGRKAA